MKRGYLVAVLVLFLLILGLSVQAQEQIDISGIALDTSKIAAPTSIAATTLDATDGENKDLEVKPEEQEEVPQVLQCTNTENVQRSGNVWTLKITDPKSGEQSMITAIPTGNSITFGGDIVVYDPSGNVATESATVVITEEKNLVQVISPNIGSKLFFEQAFGIPVIGFNKGKLVLYTLGDREFLLGSFLLSYERGDKFTVCETTEKSECSDGVDNEGDGFIDFSGRCVVTDQRIIQEFKDNRIATQGKKRASFLCGCDFDGSLTLSNDEYIGIELCDENSFQYFCEDLKGNFAANSCDDLNGEYFYYDEFCESPTGNEGRNACIDNNIVLMEEACLEIYPKSLSSTSCLRTHGKEMSVYCQENFEGGASRCGSHDECDKGQICDFEFFSCVSLEDEIAVTDAKSCKTNKDCSGTLICEQNFCVQSIKSAGIISPSNPFFNNPVATPIAAATKAVTGVVNRNNADYQIQQLKQENAKVAILEQEKREGKISVERANNLQAKSIERSAVVAESAAKAINVQSTKDPTDLGIQAKATQLSGLTGQTKSNLAKAVEKPGVLDTSTIRKVQEKLQETDKQIVQAPAVSTVLKESFAKAQPDKAAPKQDDVTEGKSAGLPPSIQKSDRVVLPPAIQQKVEIKKEETKAEKVVPVLPALQIRTIPEIKAPVTQKVLTTPAVTEKVGTPIVTQRPTVTVPTTEKETKVDFSAQRKQFTKLQTETKTQAPVQKTPVQQTQFVPQRKTELTVEEKIETKMLPQISAQQRLEQQRIAAQGTEKQEVKVTPTQQKVQPTQTKLTNGIRLAPQQEEEKKTFFSFLFRR